MIKPSGGCTNLLTIFLIRALSLSLKQPVYINLPQGMTCAEIRLPTSTRQVGAVTAQVGIVNVLCFLATGRILTAWHRRYRGQKHAPRAQPLSPILN